MRLIGAASREERAGAYLAPGPCWEVSAPGNAGLFVRSLPVLLRADCTLYFENTVFGAEVEQTLKPRSVPGALKIALGTIWPRPECMHVPASPDNIMALAGLFEQCASPQICDHFHAYRGDTVLLEWHDAFGRDPLLVSTMIEESQVRAFCEACGCMYCRAEAVDA